MNRQSGFTLLELVIAMAIFALLGLASWGLFDGVVRAQQGTTAHEREFRRLQRAVAVIERDVLQVPNSQSCSSQWGCSCSAATGAILWTSPAASARH
ncbi:Type II secretion system protein J [compost metagenome]